MTTVWDAAFAVVLILFGLFTLAVLGWSAIYYAKHGLDGPVKSD